MFGSSRSEADDSLKSSFDKWLDLLGLRDDEAELRQTIYLPLLEEADKPQNRHLAEEFRARLIKQLILCQRELIANRKPYIREKGEGERYVVLAALHIDLDDCYGRTGPSKITAALPTSREGAEKATRMEPGGAMLWLKGNDIVTYIILNYGEQLNADSYTSLHVPYLRSLTQVALGAEYSTKDELEFEAVPLPDNKNLSEWRLGRGRLSPEDCLYYRAGEFVGMLVKLQSIEALVTFDDRPNEVVLVKIACDYNEAVYDAHARGQRKRFRWEDFRGMWPPPKRRPSEPIASSPAGQAGPEAPDIDMSDEEPETGMSD